MERLALVEWSDEMAVGHPRIDQQHQQLVRLFNRFYVALKIEDECRSSEIRNAFCSLALYTHLHYKMEEDLMELSGYPWMIQHIKGHDQVRGEIDSVLESFNQDRVDEMALVDLMSTWMPSIPISGDDMDLAVWLRDQTPVAER